MLGLFIIAATAILQAIRLKEILPLAWNDAAKNLAASGVLCLLYALVFDNFSFAAGATAIVASTLCFDLSFPKKFSLLEFGVFGALGFSAVLLEFLKLFGPRMIHVITDSQTYHLPRIVEWAKRGEVFWIDSAEFRLNTFPRLQNVLGAASFSISSYDWAIFLPQFLVCGLFLWFWCQAVAPAWSQGLLFLFVLAIPQYFLQLRSFLVDAPSTVFLLGFFYFWSLQGAALWRLAVSLAFLSLAQGTKPLILIGLPSLIFLLFFDREIRRTLFTKLGVGVATLGIFSICLASKPYFETWKILNTPFYPATVKIGPIEFEGTPAMKGAATMSQFSRPLSESVRAGLRKWMQALGSVGDQFKTWNADTGGYGPHMRLLAIPLFFFAILGWRRSPAARLPFLGGLFYSMQTMALSNTDGGVFCEARYFLVLTVLLGLSAIWGIPDRLRKWAYPILLAVLSFGFFKTSSVAHTRFFQEILRLPKDIISQKKEIESAKDVGMVSVWGYNRAILPLYGTRFQNRVAHLNFPSSDPFWHPPSRDLDALLSDAEENWESLWSKIQNLDEIQLDRRDPIEFREYLAKRFVQSGFQRDPIDESLFVRLAI